MEAPSFLKPLIDPLPEGVRDFMSGGGWLLVVGVVLLIVVLIIWSAFRGKKKEKPVGPDLDEDLSAYPPPPAVRGPRLRVHDLPARLRLVTIAPLGLEGGTIRAEEVEGLLDRVVPGLGACARADKPRVRVWPMQLSPQGFAAAFQRHTFVPGPERGPSRWVLLIGRAIIDRRPVGLGLALLADQETTLGKLVLEHPHQWAQVARVRQA